MLHMAIKKKHIAAPTVRDQTILAEIIPVASYRKTILHHHGGCRGISNHAKLRACALGRIKTNLERNRIGVKPVRIEIGIQYGPRCRPGLFFGGRTVKDIVIRTQSTLEIILRPTERIVEYPA